MSAEEPTPMIPQPMKVDDEPDVYPAWIDPPAPARAEELLDAA